MSTAGGPWRGRRDLVHLQHLVTYRPPRRLSLADVGDFWGEEADGELRVAGPDEDAVTLAHAAASFLPRPSLEDCSVVILARPTGADGSGDGAAVVAMALGLRPEVRTFEITGSDRCFIEALEVAAALVRSATAGSVLVVAGDDTDEVAGSRAERMHGHGSAAAVVSSSEGIARFGRSDAIAHPVPDRWFDDRRVRQGAGERFIATTIVPEVLGMLGRIPVEGATPADHVVVALPDRAAAKKVSAALGAEPDSATGAWTGGAPGAVLPAVLLAETLTGAAPGASVDLYAFGSGVSRIRFLAHAATRPAIFVEEPGPEVPYSIFLRRAGGLRPGLAAPASSPVSATRDIAATLGLLGSSCAACGTVAYPIRTVCANCAVPSSGSTVRLSGEASVVTTTTDHLVAGVNPGTPESPTTMVVAETSEGARLFLPAVHGHVPAVGSKVRTVLRLAHLGGGFRNYHWRFAPMGVVAREGRCSDA